MKKNNIIKYSIFLVLVILILLCLYDNFQKNKEKYTLMSSITTKNTRPTL